MNEEMHLSNGASYIISRLCEYGFRADAVGGCVRDFLIGKTPTDYDITTSATPEEMKEVFSKDKIVETGIKHGTLTVIVDGEPFEVTTYRIDGEYADSRHPNSVKFSRKIEDDLSRRDFTVNAMAYNPDYGYTDIFGGRDDLKRGIIRAVGVPEERFSEDALRILRALRFASVLDFQIEPKTSEALVALSDNLSFVSAERIYTELKKLFLGKGAYRILSEYKSVIEKVIPNAHGFNLPGREKFDNAPPVSRFAALFARKSARETKDALAMLKSDVATRELLVFLIENHNCEINGRYEIKKLLSLYGESAVRELLEYRKMLSLSRIDEQGLLSDVLRSGECYKLSMLSVSGADITSLGFRGPAVGEILSALLDSVMRGKTENDREVLKSMAAKMTE